MNALTIVRGQEAETFKALAKFVRDDVDRARRDPGAPAHPAAVLAEGRGQAAARRRCSPTSARCRPADRTSPDGPRRAAARRRAGGAAAADQAKAVRKELGELGVRVIRLGTVLDQMLFDKERLVVQAGKPVEFVFENTDMMPHNFVIDAARRAGGDRPAGRGDGHRSPAPLERQLRPAVEQDPARQPAAPAARVAEARASPRRRKPGVYPYVCTYPGHWRRMYGALYVVEDLDDYLADPEAYLAKHPLPIADELLKFNRPRKEWKFDDLAAVGRAARARPVVRQRQADVPGRQLRRLPQARTASATSSAPT